jgi:hypothetical protein
VRVVASVVDAGAVVLRMGAAAVVFLTATEAACGRAEAVFLAVEEAVPVVAFLALVPVRVGFCTVVPEEAVEDMLFLRSFPCRVAGRGRGDLTARGPVAARAVVFLT